MSIANIGDDTTLNKNEMIFQVTNDSLESSINFTNMNISETNFTNITKYGYDLNKNFPSMFASNRILVLYFFLGLLTNCLVLYSYTLESPKGDKFGVVLLALVDLTASILGWSCGLALNTNPINFYGDSLCAFMLGSNMLLWNLSGVCILNVVTYRYIILRFPLFQINNRKRKLITVIGMLMSIFFSIPSFIFYGETKISVRFQNVTVSGTVCGVFGISDNGILFQVYPIVVTTIFIVLFLYLSCIQIHLTTLFYRGLAKMEQERPNLLNRTIAHSNIKNSSKINDIYADKDFSVIDSNAFICNSCDKFETKTKSKTDDILKMKSAYEIMLDVDISISDNMNQFGDASNSLKESNNSRFRIISRGRRLIWYGLQPLILTIFALLLYLRGKDLFVTSNFFSEISEINFGWNWLCIGNVINSALNPALHSCFISFNTLMLARKRVRQYLRSCIL